jgi:DNA-binding XRE family transcriptional regulator
MEAASDALPVDGMAGGVAVSVGGASQTLRQMRSEKGITQVQMAKQAGVCRTYMRDFEYGTRGLDARAVRRIARALGVSTQLVLSAPPTVPPPYVTVKMVMRDGRPVRVKRCAGCGVEKVVDDDPLVSQFTSMGRRSDGRARTWVPRCRVCESRRLARWREDHRDRVRAQSQATYRRIRQDPERLAVWRDRMRAAGRRHYARRADGEEFRARNRARVAAWRAAKIAEDPGFFTIERKAQRVARASAGAPDVVGCGPCRLWLFAFSIQRALWTMSGDGRRSELSAGRLAAELGLNPRRLQSVLFGDQDRVSVELVDAMILNCDVVVTVAGEDVWSVADLYDLERDVQPLRAGAVA